MRSFISAVALRGMTKDNSSSRFLRWTCRYREQGCSSYHPPLFKVTSETGSFRAEAYADPTFCRAESSACTSPPPPASASLASPGPAPLWLEGRLVPSRRTSEVVDQPATQTLVDNFRATLQGGKAAGILPIKVDFEALGPSLYLVSELTGENQSPSTDLNYQREKKAGGR